MFDVIFQSFGLDSSASQKDIKRNYNKLVTQWHPDKVKDPTRKEEAEIKFLEIQRLYKLLLMVARQRSKDNA